MKYAVNQPNSSPVQKQRETVCSDELEFFRGIWEVMECCLFVVDVIDGGTEFRFTLFNPAFTKTSPTITNWLLGKTLAEALDPDLAQIYRHYYSECVHQGQVICFEEKLYVDNQESWWEQKVAPLKDKTGSIIKLVITAISQDTSERKLQLAKITEQEQFLRSIYDGCSNIIFVVDIQENGEFIFTGFNEAVEKKTSLNPTSMLNKTPIEVFGESVGGKIQQNYLDCVNTGIAMTYEEFLDISDTGVWALTTINPLKDITGRIYRIVGTSTNITQHKKAQAELQAKAIELEKALHQLASTQAKLIHSEKMSSLGQLVAGIAHEINNPTSFIYGNVAFAEEYIQNILELLYLYQRHYPQPIAEIQKKTKAIELDFLKQDLPKLFHSMKVGTQRISDIVSSLRSFSRMDEADFKRVNIHEGIDSALMILEHRLRKQPNREVIEVIKQYGQFPSIHCYAGQLNQVFMNILVNAIDALDEAAINLNKFQPLIRINTSINASNQVTISISNNGADIPPYIQQRLFDPFFTTKPVGKGTGMGLYISYQIIAEKHNGSLKCLSHPGEGVTFVIKIPWM